MKISIHLIFIITLCVSFSSDVESQTTVNDFILTAFEDPNLSEYSDRLNFLEKGNYKIPLADEIEFRYSNDERTIDDSRYQLRLRASNPWKIRRNNALFNARKEELSLRQSLVYKENLFNRYELLISYYFTSKKAEISNNQLNLAQRKILLFEQLTQSELFDARDFVDAKLDLIEVLDDFDEISSEVSLIELRILQVLNAESIDWSDFELISIHQIQEVLNEVVSSTFNSTESKYLMQQVEVARLESSVEKSDFDFGFLQAEYAPFRNNGDNELGFSFGINLPIFKNNRDQIAERILDEIEIENEFEALQYSDSLNKILDSNFLSAKIKHHQLLLQEIENLDLENLSFNLAQSEGNDPIILLELEEGKLKLQEIVVRSMENLMDQYLDFLFSYDVLSQRPLKNYLSNDLTLIE